MSHIVSDLIPALGSGVVAWGGSRALSPAAAGRAFAIASGLIGAGRPLVCGCCIGADAAAVRAGARSGLLSVMAAWGPDGAGACGLSAKAWVMAAARGGSQVAWWAGGGPCLPLGARLANRTRAVANAAVAGAVVFFGAPSSAGSALLAGAVAARGLPVLAISDGFGSSRLPAVGAGAWWPVTSSLALWRPAQTALAL